LSFGNCLQPGVVWYCVVMLAFAAAAAVLGHYWLAGAEAFATLAVFCVSRIRFARRRRILMDYVQRATDSVGVSVHAGSPFPMAVLRLPENEIVWGNPAFFTVTGLSDRVRYQTFESVVPGFTADFLREGRGEYPGDQLIGSRRSHLWQLRPLGRRRDDRPARDGVSRGHRQLRRADQQPAGRRRFQPQRGRSTTASKTGRTASHGLLRKLERNRYLLS
jgi:hypothetical protein